MTISREEYEFLNNPEKAIANWLIKHNITFDTQVPLFGIGELGSATVDFILSERNVIIRCMGTFWHSTLETNARDLLGKEKLTAAGYMVVDVKEENLTAGKIDTTLELALQGQEVL